MKILTVPCSVIVPLMLSLLTQRAHAQQTPPTAPPPPPEAATDSKDRAKPMQMDPNMPGMKHGKGQQGMKDMGGMHGMDMSMGKMLSTVDLLAPMNQEGSGTSWLPSSTPMYGRMYMRGGNMYMVHGAITPRYVNVPTERGQKDFSAPNWVMGMYGHALSPTQQLGVRAMLSLDYITNGNDGYPLLFQSGESYRGKRLVDRQHPHDLFSELAVAYSQKVSSRTSAFAYVGYPGEPALGPPTFMHRLIALDYPDSPLGHHWTDATHISFGVGTVGVNFGGKFKAEGSVFTGREPDERRYDFDRPRFDSQSGRLSWNPDARNAFQVSYGFIKEPETLEPGVNQNRTTASWLYNRPLGADRNFTTSLVWGRNHLSSSGSTDAYLAEAVYQSGRDSVFTRLETVKKTGEELNLAESDHDRKFNVGAYTVGYLRDISHNKGIDVGVGGTITVNTKPSALDPYYGSGNPVSFQIMFRLRPSKMGDMSGMSGMGTMPGMGAGGNQGQHQGHTMP
jgi:hypothetical protein